MPASDLLRYRERLIPMPYKATPRRIGNFYAYYNGKWNYNGPVDTTWPTGSYSSAESVIDQKHDKIHGLWANGGPFTSIKVLRGTPELQGNGVYDSGARTQFYTGLGFVKIKYVGGFCNPGFPGDPISTSTYSNIGTMLGAKSSLLPSLTGWGPEAWARTAPKMELGSMGVALGEASDISPMLHTSARAFNDIWKVMGGSSGITTRDFRRALRRGNLKRLGHQAPQEVSDHFLNHVFGWAPFISDLSKFADNNARFFQMLDHWRKNNGQWKHYRRTLRDDVVSTLIASGTGMRCEPLGYTIENVICAPGTCRWEVWEEKYTLVTTSGRFKFYIPTLDQEKYPEDKYPSMGVLAAWLRMHGLRASPSVIWRATPWTWLIDWQLNVGRNLDALTGAVLDGVVADYLYLMHHTVSDLVCKQYLSTGSGDVTLEWRRRIDVKQRKRSESPYGFDSPWETLSPMRLAILAALGISRSTR